jgi:N-methylhydantoinase A
VAERLADLADEGVQALMAEGLARGDLVAESSLDLRYRGQSYSLNVPWQGVVATAEGFHQAHLARYGHRLDLPVELVNLRARVMGPEPPLRLAEAPPLAAGSQRSMARVAGWEAEVPVLPRSGIAGGPIAGPAIIIDPVATTWLAPGWVAEANPYGNLLLRRGLP